LAASIAALLSAFDEFAQPGVAIFTKRLVFSCWNVVPKVIAASLAMEAEKTLPASTKPESYQPHRTRERKKGRCFVLPFPMPADWMPVLGIIYPAGHLASLTDPLAPARRTVHIARRIAFRSGFRSGQDRVKSALDTIKLHNISEGAADEAGIGRPPF